MIIIGIYTKVYSGGKVVGRNSPIEFVIIWIRNCQFKKSNPNW